MSDTKAVPAVASGVPNPQKERKGHHMPGARLRHSSRIVANLDEFGHGVDPSQLKQHDFDCETLRSKETYVSPMADYWEKSEGSSTDVERRMMYDPRPQAGGVVIPEECRGMPISQSPFTMRLANPRHNLHFNPSQTVVGIVTCGGLCPGLNDVIRALTMSCIRHYKVKRVIGFRFGFWGLSAKGRDSCIDLSAEVVRNIHVHGGTFLGSSRGPQQRSEMVDTLVDLGVNILFAVGGDGTQRGAEKIATECRARGLDIAVMGIPKTIDNDLSFSHRTFGYESAVGQAVAAVRAAHAEASSHEYGVGIVKVMGRHSGFIAAEATVASALVNICLIPEMPIGEDLVYQLVMKRFEKTTNCVIVVAEGFGQNWGAGSGGKDASGNAKLIDIGAILRDKVAKWIKEVPKYKGGTVKYIDPSYMIRACPPSPADAAFSVGLAGLAVHEAMAGTTNALISSWYNNFVVIPIRLATSLRREVCVHGRLWRQVRELTVWLEEDTKIAKTKVYNDELISLERRIATINKKLSKL